MSKDIRITTGRDRRVATACVPESITTDAAIQYVREQTGWDWKATGNIFFKCPEHDDRRHVCLFRRDFEPTAEMIQDARRQAEIYNMETEKQRESDRKEYAKLPDFIYVRIALLAGSPVITEFCDTEPTSKLPQGVPSKTICFHKDSSPEDVLTEINAFLSANGLKEKSFETAKRLVASSMAERFLEYLTKRQ